jgi:hypothetical protein
MAQRKAAVDRRKFIAGVLTGGGLVAALATAAPKVRAAKSPAASRKTTSRAEPILYRRTEESERYYRTLYV